MDCWPKSGSEQRRLNDGTIDSLSRAGVAASNANDYRAKVRALGWGFVPGSVLSSCVVPQCVKCEGGGWVCEGHPRKPFPHFVVTDRGASDCPGPGMPCDCEAGAGLVAALDAKYRTA